MRTFTLQRRRIFPSVHCNTFPTRRRIIAAKNSMYWFASLAVSAKRGKLEDGMSIIRVVYREQG